MGSAHWLEDQDEEHLAEPYNIEFEQSFPHQIQTFKTCSKGYLRMHLFSSHLDPPANGQEVIFLKGLLEVFYSELSNLATVSDNSVRYQAITVVKR